MTDSDEGTLRPGRQFSRRWWLQSLAVGAASTIGVAGTSRGQQAVTIRWEFETDGAIEYSSPTVVDGTVYIGSDDDFVYAVDAETGTQEWRTEVGPTQRSSPMVVDGVCFIGSKDAYLYALNAETGDVLWRYETGDMIRTSPTVVDATVYVGSNDEAIHAVDAETGTEHWTVDLGDVIRSSPTVADGTVYVSPGDNTSREHLYALDAETGDEQWQLQTDHLLNSSPTVADGTVYVGGWDETVYAIDSVDGSEVWRVETESGVDSSPTVAEGTVYIGADESLMALDAETGAQEWTFGTDDQMRSSPTVAGDNVYFGAGVLSGGTIYAVNKNSGQYRWDVPVEAAYSSPTVVDGIIYVGGGQTLYAFDGRRVGSPDSEGSRADLGTFGHHNGWRYSDQTIEIDPVAGSRGFEPATDAFGFPNWSGETGCETYPEPNSCSEDATFELSFNTVGLQTVRDALSEWSISMPSTQLKMSALAARALVVRQSVSNGHCYGIVFAAKEYAADPSALPEDIDSASDIPRPSDAYESVGEKIRQYHVSQKLSSEVFWATMCEFWFGAIDYESAADDVMDALDDGTAALLLGQSDADGAHQVLAYDYVENDGTIEFHLYDPNVPAYKHQEAIENDETLMHTYVVDAETGEPTDPHQGYDQYAYVDPDLSLEAAGALTSTPEELFGQFDLSSVFTLHSPATLAVDAPDDATVVQPTENAYDGVLSDAAIVLGAQPEAIEVTVIGDGEGEYSLDAVSADGDQVVVDDTVTDTIGAEERYAFRLSGTEDAEGSLTRSDGDTTVRRDTEAESDSLPSGSDGLPLWGSVAGGVGLLGGAGAYLYRRVSGDKE